jgi:glycosyltransferase involved in cell wall biosynthesis
MLHVYCDYFGSTGWARHARGFLAGLRRHVDIGLFSWNTSADGTGLSEQVGRMQARAREHSVRVALGIGPIERMATLAGEVRIAFVVWETTRLPRAKLKILRAMDQIWTPSRWGRELLIANGLPAERIRVVPEGVDANRFAPQPAARPEGDRTFRMLCVGKWERRKGIDDLVTACSRAFTRDEDVELVLASHNPYIKDFDARQALDRLRVRNMPRIRLCPPGDDRALVQRYNQADVFVLPTKAEGWGLPIIEAMACGLPVIVTDYSAQREYVTPDCGYLIPVKRMALAHDPVFYRGLGHGRWAQPDRKALQLLLRQAYEQRHELRHKGAAARQQVVGGWTWQHAADKAVAILDEAGWLR